MRKEVLLLAGGKGLRAGGDLPKQFQDLGGRPLLWWSLRSFHDYDPEMGITIVMNPEYLDLWKKLMDQLPADDYIPHNIEIGGKERGESVANGLKALIRKYGNQEENVGHDEIWVAVHDGARPLISTEMIRRGFATAFEAGSAVPVCAVTDSLRELKAPENFEDSVPADRSRFVAVQTPQIFPLDILIEAYEKAEKVVFTDDASLVEAALRLPISLYHGDPANIKVTHPIDFAIAGTLLNTKSVFTF